jgi:hypothetical protein
MQRPDLEGRVWGGSFWPRGWQAEWHGVASRSWRRKALAGLPGYPLLDSLAVDGAGTMCGGVNQLGLRSSPDGSSVEFSRQGTRSTRLCFGGPGSTRRITLGSPGKLSAMDWPRSGLKLHTHADLPQT